MYEVSDRYGKYKVDILLKNCSFEVWQLSDIPCHHGVTGILHQERAVEDFVDPCYSIETYLKSYNHLIKPMSDSNDWPITNSDVLLPPLTKRLAGRSKRCRRRDPNEGPKSTTRVSKKGTVITCSKCKQSGHNKLGCKNTLAGEPQNGARRPKLPVSVKFYYSFC